MIGAHHVHAPCTHLVDVTFEFSLFFCQLCLEPFDQVSVIAVQGYEFLLKRSDVPVADGQFSGMLTSLCFLFIAFDLDEFFV